MSYFVNTSPSKCFCPTKQTDGGSLDTGRLAATHTSQTLHSDGSVNGRLIRNGGAHFFTECLCSLCFFVLCLFIFWSLTHSFAKVTKLQGVSWHEWKTNLLNIMIKSPNLHVITFILRYLTLSVRKTIFILSRSQLCFSNQMLIEEFPTSFFRAWSYLI